MIKQFIFKDFKCFKDVRINVENLTFLIGTNASGKTNAVEGMMILSELMSGREISTVLDGSSNSEGLIRGGARGCGRLGSTSFTLGCLIQFEENVDLEYEIEIITENGIGVRNEFLTEIKGKKNRQMFAAKEPEADSGEIIVSCNNGKKGKHPEINCMRSSAVISQIITKLSTETLYGKQIVEYAKYIVSELKQILYLNPDTHRMRNYAAINDNNLKVDASNISSVLYRLCENETQRSRLLGMLRDLPENKIVDIEFEKGPLNDVILFLKEQYGEKTETTDAGRLSDGTLRCLAILAALLSRRENSMIVVEEIDNGVHPGRCIKLIHTISEIARERNIDILLTTHNAVMLNALTKEDLAGVNVVYRKEDGDGEVISFFNIPDMPLMLTGGKLGDVFLNDRILQFIKGTVPKADFAWLEI